MDIAPAQKKKKRSRKKKPASQPEIPTGPIENPYRKPEICLTALDGAPCPFLGEPGPTFANGPKDATSLYLLEAPGKEESIPHADGIRRPATGPAGQHFDRTLSKAGEKRERIRVGNSVCCFPPMKMVSGKPKHPVTKEAFQACGVHRDRLLKSMPRLRHINLMGKWAAASLLGPGAQIDTWQGAQVRRSEVDLQVPAGSLTDHLLTFSIHPSRSMHNRMELPVFQDQLNRATRVGIEESRKTERRPVRRRPMTVIDLDAPPTQPVRIAWGGIKVVPMDPTTFWSDFPSTGRIFFDTETEGRDEDQHITQISFATQRGFAASGKWSAELREWIRPFFENPFILKIAHNFQFDFGVLKKAGIEIVPPWFCTMTGLAIIYPDLPNRLEYGVMMCQPAGFVPWKFTNETDPVAYSGVDAGVLPDLWEWEMARLQEKT